MNGTVTAEDVKILKDLTGEDRLDAAVHMTLKDAVEHKLEKIEDGIKAFERKHGAKFNDFRNKRQIHTPYRKGFHGMGGFIVKKEKA